MLVHTPPVLGLVDVRFKGKPCFVELKGFSTLFATTKDCKISSCEGTAAIEPSTPGHHFHDQIFYVMSNTLFQQDFLVSFERITILSLETDPMFCMTYAQIHVN